MAKPTLSPPAPPRPTKSLSGRLTALSLLLLIELMVISFNFDSYLPQLSNGGQWFAFLAYAGQFAKVIVVIIAAVTLAIWERLPEHTNKLKTALVGYKFYYFTFIQLAVYIVFYKSTAAIFGDPNNANNVTAQNILLWFISLLAVASMWLLSVAPKHFWQTLLRTEKAPILLSFMVGILAWWLAQSSQALWGPLSDLTFSTSAFFLDLMYQDIVVDPVLKNLGTAGFVVNIAPSCSGYEGIGLVLIFTAFYLSTFRKEFRFPQALLLFPIGVATIWLFNTVRIALLIGLGSSFSEQVALGGFHSQAGWISFILVICGLLLAAHKLSFFSRQARPATVVSNKPPQSSALASALLIPFIALLASTIISTSLSAEFSWLYPLRVVTVAMALFYCWHSYAFRSFKIKFEPIFAGVLVFVIWIFLVPDNVEQNNLFADTLFSASLPISVGWLIFRVIGTVITVPLAEELLFRGYLFARLSKQKILLEGSVAFSWLGLLLPSLLFGLLHSNFLAGTLAGLVYGVVRYRGNSVLDAVIAHAVTNLLLSILVLSTEQWSLW